MMKIFSVAFLGFDKKLNNLIPLIKELSNSVPRNFTIDVFYFLFLLFFFS